MKRVKFETLVSKKGHDAERMEKTLSIWAEDWKRKNHKSNPNYWEYTIWAANIQNVYEIAMSYQRKRMEALYNV